MMDSSYRRSARVSAEAGSRAGSWITRIQNSADTCADQSEASIHGLDQSEASIHEMDQSWASIFTAWTNQRRVFTGGPISGEY